MAYQWITCPGYALLSREVPGGENLAFPLVTTPDYSTIDLGALEAGAERDYIVKRIVGQVYLYAPQTITGTLWVGWRIMGLPYDYANSEPERPWTTSDSPLRSSDISNEPRWWAERWWQEIGLVGGTLSLTMEAYSHPYWAHVDISPDAMCGPGHGMGLYPTIVYDNTANLDTVAFVHRLRMLVTAY